MSGTLIEHCAVFGTHKWPFRKFQIGDVVPYAQFAKSVSIGIVPPGKRKLCWHRALDDNLTYYTIEDADGVEIYDSRSQVPCDMAAFRANQEQNADVWVQR